MDRWGKLCQIRHNLKRGEVSLGSWMQIPNTDVAEIMGKAGFDWIAVDLEHGSIGVQQLPDIFRALELGETLPLVRIALGNAVNCKDALDAGASGVIVPKIESREEVEEICAASCWPPKGHRGVGFSRANLFGKYFDNYREEASAPFIVVQIETIKAVENIKEIISVPGLDAVFIGPYDLSASMGLTGDLEHPDVQQALESVLRDCNDTGIPAGLHVVKPSEIELVERITAGYTFIAYSIDAVFLHTAVEIPKIFKKEYL